MGAEQSTIRPVTDRLFVSKFHMKIKKKKNYLEVEHWELRRLQISILNVILSRTAEHPTYRT